MSKKANSIILKIVLIFLGIGFLFPLYWTVLLSLKEKTEVYVNPFGLPYAWDILNYETAAESINFFKALGNSMVYTLGTCILTLLFGSMIAYVIARTKFRHGSKLLMMFTMGLVIPVNVVMIPLYSIIFKMGLKGTIWSLILPYTAFQIPSTVLMLYAFLRALPSELEEAAALDGANIYRTFFQIIMPLLTPALTTRFILVFQNVWNEFSLSLVLANTTDRRPLPIALLSFFVETIGTPDWGVIGAAMVLCSVPSVIIFMFGSKNLENALTVNSGMK